LDSLCGPPIYEEMNAPTRRRVRRSSPFDQTDLFIALAGSPEGFRYCPGVLSVEEEEALACELARLAFKPFDFHGYQANRKVVSFGYRYDYDRRAVVEVGPFSAFSSLLETQGCRDVRPPGRLFPTGAHQRVSTGRRNRLAPRQSTVRRGRRRVVACALLAALPPEGVWWLGACVAQGRAALGLSPFGAGANGLGAQHSGPRSPSLFHHLANAPCRRAS
jgi:hypothetical protein